MPEPVAITTLLLACSVPQHGELPGGEPRQGLTIVQARDWAQSIERSLARGEGEPLDAALDEGAILDRAAAGMDLSPAYLAGARAGLLRDSSTSESILAAIRGGGSFTLLRVREVSGEVRALFRLLRADGDLDYRELHLAAGADGGVRIVDSREFLVGLTVSEQIRREQFAESGWAATLDNSRAAGVAVRVADLARAGKPGEALAALDQLPERARQRRDFLLMRIGIAHGMDPAAHRAAVEALRRADPTNPCLGIHTLPLYRRLGEHDPALAAIDGLARETGGDPYLDYLRAGVLRAKGDPDGAKRLLERVTAALPTLRPAYGLGIEIALAERDWAEVARLLTSLEDRCGVEIRDDLGEVPAYAEFAESNEYRQWRQRRDAKRDKR